MPVAVVEAPPPDPRILKPLQSIVTLLVWISIMLPLVAEVSRFCRRHQVPWVVMVAGSASMNPKQLS